MASKDYYLSRDFKLLSTQSSQKQYSNLNLNNCPGFQRDGNLFNSAHQSDGISMKFAAGKRDQYSCKEGNEIRVYNHQVRQLIQKWESKISSNDFDKKKGNKTITEKSTLLLHITAYENTINDQKRDDDVAARKPKANEIKKFVGCFASPFEIPRQQKENIKEPEIMQFKASQKLLTPNAPQQPTSNGEQQSAKDTVKKEPKSNVAKSQDEIILYSKESHDEFLNSAAERKLEQCPSEPMISEALPPPFTTKKNVYTFNKKLGWGASGEVFEVSDSSKNVYALKLFHHRLAKYAFLAESQVLRLSESIESPHFSKIVEIGRMDNTFFIIQELLGPTVENIVKDASNITKYVLAKQSLNALMDMHKLGLLHTDSKSDNFCLGKGDKSQILFLIDFDRAVPIKEDQMLDVPEDGVKYFTRKDDLLKWFYMTCSWFSVQLGFLDLCKTEEEKMATSSKNYELLKAISPGFQIIYLCIENLKRGEKYYDYISKTLDLEIQKLTQGRPIKLEWATSEYKEIESSRTEPDKIIYEKFCTPFYAKSQKEGHVLVYFGSRLLHRKDSTKQSEHGRIDVFECRTAQKRCEFRIEVLNYDPKKTKAGDRADIFFVRNYHTCSKGKHQSKNGPKTYFTKSENVDFSMFE